MAQVVSRRSIIYDLTFDTRQSKTAASDMDALGKKIDTAANEIQEFSNKTTSAVQRLRQIKNELNTFKGSEDRFRALTLEAAKLQDQLNKTNDRIRTLASSTRNIQALISVASGLTGVFTAVSGASALWGDKNEDLQKTLVKLNGSLALLQGLQVAIATVTEQSTAKTVIAEKAQNLYAFAVGRSTGAMKAFRIALALTGVGLLVIALGALIANFDKVKAKVFEFIPGLSQLGNAFKALGAGIVETFKVLGDVIGAFFTDGLDGAIKAAEEGGKRISGAFDEAFYKDQQERAKQREKQIIEQSLRNRNFLIQQLEAQGKETLALQIRQKHQEIKALDKTDADYRKNYAEKYNELLILIGKLNQQRRDAETTANLESVNSIANLTKQIGKLQDQLSNTEIGTQQFFALTEQIKLLNIELEAAKALIEGLQDLEFISAKEIEKTEDFTQTQATVNDTIKAAESSLLNNKQRLMETSEVYDLLAQSASSAGQVFANVAQLAADGSKAQLGLSIASVIASQAEALAAGVKSAAAVQWPANIPAIFSVIATITGVFAQIRALSQQANSMKSKGQGNAVAFAEGEVDIHRKGETRGKDSIPAVIMPGESVITTEKTALYKPFLQAIHEGSLEDLIRVNYVEPALAMAALDNAKNHDTVDYSEKFYRQYLATNEGNAISKKAISVNATAASTLKRIEKKIGKGWYV